MSVRQRIAGGAVEEVHDSSRGGLTVGPALILDKADPDTDVQRVARWIVRAQAEGVIGGWDP